MTENSSNRTQLFFSILSFFILILICYANTLSSPFNFDDQALLQQVIINDPQGFLQFWPMKYRHIFYLSFGLNHSLSGLNPLSYHLFNLLVHFSTSSIIFLITYKGFSSNEKWGKQTVLAFSWITATLFAINPIHTESITYISGRASALSGFFFLLALFFFILGSQKKNSKTALTPIYYSLTLLAFGLALLSKETAITFPLAAILYDLCFMRNENWHPFKSRLLCIYLPVAVLTYVFLVLSPVIKGLMIEWLGKIDLGYAFAQARVLFYVLKLYLFPINLNFDNDFPIRWIAIDFSNLIPVIGWIVIAIVMIKGFRKASPTASFAILWFLITIAPTNSFLPRPDLLSERNLYLPSFGLTLFTSYILFKLFFLKKGQNKAKHGFVALGVLFLILISLTINRNSDYRSNISLWEDTYKKSPEDLKVLHNLSHFYLEGQRYQQAIVPLLKLSHSEAGPFYRSFAHSNLGSIYTKNRNFEKARQEFKKAIALEPTLPLGYLNLGAFYASRGQLNQARTEFLRARERYIKFKWGYPMPALLDLNLARVNFHLKFFEEAEKFVLLYLQKFSDSPDGLLLQGKIYQEEGKLELAEQTFHKVRGGGLASAKAYNNLGILYIRQNKYEKAQKAFIASIQMDAKIPDAHYNLGKLILDLQGNHTSVSKHLKSALAYSQSVAMKKEIHQLLKQINLP